MRIGLNRSLAASAVGALAVTGLAVGVIAGPAGAAGPAVVFVSLHNQNGDGSVRFDGWDNAVDLVAMRLDPAATITFQYNLDPAAGDATAGWTTAPGTVTLAGDYARLPWVPDASLLGREVAIRAVATVGGTSTYSTRQGVAIARAEWGTETVAVNRYYPSSDDSTVGFFDQPYASTSRTATHLSVQSFTSATGGTAQVSWWNPATQAFQGSVDAAVLPSDLKVPGIYSGVPGGGVFYADLDITAFDADAGDILAVAAELDTDDVRASALYAQTLGTVNATAPLVPDGQPTTATVQVLDSMSRPMAGVEVRRVGGSLVGYTDGAGLVRDPVVGGAVPASYYANATDTDAYEAGTDLQDTTDVAVPAASDLLPVFVDGRVFDDDEYAAGDLYLLVNDGLAPRTPIPGESVEYRIYPTGSTPPATYQTAVSGADGRAVMAFAPQGPDGDYTIDYHFPLSTDTTVTFTAGDGAIAFTPAAGSAAPGGQVTLRAGLTVAGKPLQGRRVGATYARGVELVPGTTADAGLVSGAQQVLSLNGASDTLGAFTVTVRDPAEAPQGAEPGGKLTVATLAAAAGRHPLTGNAAETASATVVFGTAKGKAKVKLKGKSAGRKDKLVVKGPDSLGGEKVTFFRMSGKKLVKLKSKRLNKSGDVVLKVADKNGSGTTTYVVKVVPSDRVQGSKSKKVEVD